MTLRSEELHSLISTSRISVTVQVTEDGVQCIEEMRNASRILIGKTREHIPPGRNIRNLGMILKWIL